MFKPGEYKTKFGHVATVIRTKCVQGEFKLIGYVKYPETNILYPHMWFLSGHSVLDNTAFDLTNA